MICDPENVPALISNARNDDVVQKEGLAASKERDDRYRPSDEQLCKARDAKASIRWTFRDGTTVKGKVVAFGRWDIDIELKDGGIGTVFFHALHRETGRQLKRFS